MELKTQQIRLATGRILGFAEFGAPEGTPILYCHGWPGSRLEASAMHEVCRDMGVRLIAPDRPGLGLSDYQPGRKLVDFADDVNELSAHLELKRFGVLGVSGGGPYAVACGAKLSQRLSSLLLICSVGPADAPDATKGMVLTNRCLLSVARRFPKLAQGIGSVCLWAIWRTGDQVIPKQIEARLPPADRRALESPNLRRALTASSVEALRRGSRAAATDGLLYGRPWGFSLGDVHVPAFLWHGEKDVVVPVTMGRYLAANIPGCQGHFYPEDGHFSLPFTRLREILKSAIV